MLLTRYIHFPYLVISSSSIPLKRSFKLASLLYFTKFQLCRNMSYCGMQQQNTFTSSCEEMRSAVSASFDRGVHMVCPKPRRLSLLDAPVNEPVRPLRWHMCYQPEPHESIAGLELLELIFEKAPVASPSSFFNGSPPSRVSNPLTQDARFRDRKSGFLISGRPIPSSGVSSEKKVGSVGGSFGDQPAVRIEGFDCIATLA